MTTLTNRPSPLWRLTPLLALAALATPLSAAQEPGLVEVDDVRPGFGLGGTEQRTFTRPDEGHPHWRLIVAPAQEFRHRPHGQKPNHGTWNTHFTDENGGPLGPGQPGRFSCVVTGPDDPENHFQYTFTGYVEPVRAPGDAGPGGTGTAGTAGGPGQPLQPWEIVGKTASDLIVVPTRHHPIATEQEARFRSVGRDGGDIAASWEVLLPGGAEPLEGIEGGTAVSFDPPSFGHFIIRATAEGGATALATVMVYEVGIESGTGPFPEGHRKVVNPNDFPDADLVDFAGNPRRGVPDWRNAQSFRALVTPAGAPELSYEFRAQPEIGAFFDGSPTMAADDPPPHNPEYELAYYLIPGADEAQDFVDVEVRVTDSDGLDFTTSYRLDLQIPDASLVELYRKNEYRAVDVPYAGIPNASSLHISWETRVHYRVRSLGADVEDTSAMYAREHFLGEFHPQRPAAWGHDYSYYAWHLFRAAYRRWLDTAIDGDQPPLELDAPDVTVQTTEINTSQPTFLNPSRDWNLIADVIRISAMAPPDEAVPDPFEERFVIWDNTRIHVPYRSAMEALNVMSEEFDRPVVLLLQKWFAQDRPVTPALEIDARIGQAARVRVHAEDQELKEGKALLP